LWPHPEHSVRAANVVAFELICALARLSGGRVALLVVGYETPVVQDEQARLACEHLSSLGVEVLAPVTLRTDQVPRPRLARILAPRFTDYYPAADCVDQLLPTVERFGPDLLFVPWSEWLTALASRVPIAKFAYYGNPDPKGLRTQIAFRRRVGEFGALHAGYLSMRADRLERFHLEAMRQYGWLGDVAANDAEYYRSRGHPNAFYARNTWMAAPSIGSVDVRDTDCKIIASVGRVSGTANTLGLEYLGTQVLPEMRRIFGARRFELHVLGAGEVHPHVKPLISQPEIRLRGFVDDIDREIAGAAAFLCVNNATPYKVGHTRYLHAWSLRSCVVAHRDVSLSMPELRNDENAMLGADAKEIAEQLLRSCCDAASRKRIADAGRQTFVDEFTADRVVPTLLDRVRRQGA
jgi:hypothetical protein